jgi:hypothetical protein
VGIGVVAILYSFGIFTDPRLGLYTNLGSPTRETPLLMALMIAACSGALSRPVATPWPQFGHSWKNAGRGRCVFGFCPNPFLSALAPRGHQPER